jgi:FkbM family methyltransferase
MTAHHPLLEEGHQRLVRARHGYVLYNRNDTVIGRSIEMYGEYFESEVQVFRRFLAPGDVALDVGSNIGTHTLAMARLVGPAGRVIAFEPQRLVFQTLCANVAINSLDNVQCVNAAVGDAPGWLELSDPDPGVENNFGGAAVDMLTGAAHAPRVPSLPLDDFLNVDRLKLVKIDVEGMEAAVLRGGRMQISRFRPVMYVENAFPDKSPELIALLADLGYRAFWHLPLYVTRDNFFGNAERPFPVAFVDRGDAYLDAIGFAVNLLCFHGSLDVAIQGLRPVASAGEHPFRREHVALFAGADGAGIPIVRARE